MSEKVRQELREYMELVQRRERDEEEFARSSHSMPLDERMRRAAELKRRTAVAMELCASCALQVTEARD